MSRQFVSLGLVVFLFALGSFAIPFHLAFEEHDWDGHHEESGDGDSHDSQPHPASDHDAASVAAPVKTKPVQFDLVLVALVELLATPEPEDSFTELDVRDPSKVPETSQAGSRAPPLL